MVEQYSPPNFESVYYACYSRNWSQKWEVCKNQTNYWTLETIVLDLAWLKKKCFEETIAIVGSFHSNYLLDWLDIFSECLTLPVRAPTVFDLSFFDRELIKSVPKGTIVIQWKFHSNKLQPPLIEFFSQLIVKPSDIDFPIVLFWLWAHRSGIFSRFSQHSPAMFDLKMMP